MLSSVQKFKKHLEHTQHVFWPGHRIMLRMTSYHKEKHIFEEVWK